MNEWMSPLLKSKLASPWNNAADKDLRSFAAHPDIEGEYLNYYRLSSGAYVPIPEAFPNEED